MAISANSKSAVDFTLYLFIVITGFGYYGMWMLLRARKDYQENSRMVKMFKADNVDLAEEMLESMKKPRFFYLGSYFIFFPMMRISVSIIACAAGYINVYCYTSNIIFYFSYLLSLLNLFIFSPLFTFITQEFLKIHKPEIYPYDKKSKRFEISLKILSCFL